MKYFLLIFSSFVIASLRSLLRGSTRFAVLAVSLCSALHSSFAAERPNILFAIADDWGAHAGVYGTPWVKTPAFDRIAKEGVLFTKAYTPVAKCAPSRAIVLTGRHAWQNEEAGNHMAFFPAKLKSWPEVLTEKGWHMGITGKGWGPGIANDANGKPRQITGKPFNQHKAKPPAAGMGNNDYAANFTDFLDAAPKDGPWCFWYGSLEPHRGYEFQSGVKKGGKKLSDISKVPDYWPDDEIVRHDMLDYAFEVEHTDKHLARMIAELEKRGQLDNTLIIVTADHGECFGEHGHYRHGFELWQELVHVPWIFVLPGAAPRRIEVTRSHLDLAPTVLDLMGVPADPAFTGRSLVPELYGAEAEARDVIVDLPRTSDNDRRRALIHGRHKVIAYGDDSRFEVYDLVADPGETQNLARTDRPTFLAMVQRYRDAQAAIRVENPYACRTLRGAPAGRGW